MNTLRTIIALALVAHGTGHVLFLFPLLGLADTTNWSQSVQSWVLPNQSLARMAGSALLVVAAVAFCTAAYGLWGQLPWWRTAAVIAAIVSAAALIMFWTNPPSSSALFALGFDVVAFTALVMAKWPTAAMVGS